MAQFVTKEYLDQYLEYFRDPDIQNRCYEKYNLGKRENMDNFTFENFLAFIDQDFYLGVTSSHLKLDQVFREVAELNSLELIKKLQDVYLAFVRRGKSLGLRIQFPEMESLKSLGKQCSAQYEKLEKSLHLASEKALEIAELVRPKISQLIYNHYAGIEIKLNPIESCSGDHFSASTLELYHLKIVDQLVKFFKNQEFSQVYQNGATVAVYWTKDVSQSENVKKEYIHLKFNKEKELVVSL